MATAAVMRFMEEAVHAIRWDEGAVHQLVTALNNATTCTDVIVAENLDNFVLEEVGSIDFLQVWKKLKEEPPTPDEARTVFKDVVGDLKSEQLLVALKEGLTVDGELVTPEQLGELLGRKSGDGSFQDVVKHLVLLLPTEQQHELVEQLRDAEGA